MSQQLGQPIDTLDTVTVLLVDDDEHWAWATGQLLEQSEGFTVDSAHSLAAGREGFVELDPDCVVCDYDLGDGNGLGLLETVREVDPDRPFVLVTGKGDEAIASDAISRGVTDYIRKGRENEDELLATRVRTLVRAHRASQAAERERRIKTEVLDVLRETTSESDLCLQFCRQLVETDAYAMAWIGTTTGQESPQPKASAGRDEYLDAVLTDGTLGTTEPARQAADATEPVVVSVDDTDTPEGWRATAAEFGFRTVVAIPIRYEELTFGVFSVYANESAGAISVDVLEEYAGSLGYALQSFERKRSLLATEPVRVKVTVETPDAPLVALAERLPSGTTIESPSVIARDDGSTLYILNVAGIPAAEMATAVRNCEPLTALDQSETGAGWRWTVTTAEQTPEHVLAEHGARFEHTTVGDGVATVSVRLHENRSVSELAAAVEAQFPGARASTVWTDSYSRSKTEDPFADLTDKQRKILRHAFHEGYFERPRNANATEIADRLGIARQTFAQHLRAAQSKVFAHWQETE